jgi:hypothetical protein
LNCTEFIEDLERGRATMEFTEILDGCLSRVAECVEKGEGGRLRRAESSWNMSLLFAPSSSLLVGGDKVERFGKRRFRKARPAIVSVAIDRRRSTREKVRKSDGGGGQEMQAGGGV